MKKQSYVFFKYCCIAVASVFDNDSDKWIRYGGSESKADSETVLPVILALQISSDYEPETIKAQAVIARSNLYRKIGEKRV